MKATPEELPMDEMVLAERKKGNVVLRLLPDQLGITSLDEFVEQPVDGLLYDLNRSEEVVLTFIADPKWVNDFAVAQVIRKLVEQRNAARAEAADLIESLQKQQTQKKQQDEG